MATKHIKTKEVKNKMVTRKKRGRKPTKRLTAHEKRIFYLVRHLRRQQEPPSVEKEKNKDLRKQKRRIK